LQIAPVRLQNHDVSPNLAPEEFPSVFLSNKTIVPQRGCLAPTDAAMQHNLRTAAQGLGPSRARQQCKPSTEKRAREQEGPASFHRRRYGESSTQGHAPNWRLEPTLLGSMILS